MKFEFDKKIISLFLILSLIKISVNLESKLEMKTNSKTATHTSTKTLTHSKTSTSTKTESNLSINMKMSFLKNKNKNSNTSRNLNNTLSSPYIFKMPEITPQNSMSNEIIADTVNIPTVLERREQNQGIDSKELATLKGKAYWIGWVKYFKLNKNERPKSFLVNPNFKEQLRDNPNLNLNDKTSSGFFKNIRNKNSFFLTVFKENIIITTSRTDKFKSNYEVILLDNIAPLVEGHEYEGGIQDFGQFNEGFCFKVTTTKEKISVNLKLRPEKFDKEYLFCCDSESEKRQLMETLKSVKLMNQRNEGIVIIHKTKEIENMEKTEEYVENIMQIHSENFMTGNYTTNIRSQDGKWIVLQTWSECSLKCGGGVTVLHRFCVPPTGDGRPCEGEGIIRKPCNTISCKLYLDDIKKQKVVNEKPIVKILPFSSRPTRYLKCKIKESDVMIFFNTLKNTTTDELKKVMRPARVVMNTHTISLFDNSYYYSNILAFDMGKSVIKISNTRKWCIVIQQLSQTIEMCPLSMNPKDLHFKEEWNYDFELFKNQCHNDAKKNVEKELNKKLKQKMEAIRIEMNNIKREKLMEKQNEKDIEKASGDMAKAADISFKALQRETSLEEMIKNEEIEKANDRERELKLLIEKETERKNQFAKAIKEKELETETIIERQEREKRINDLKREAAIKLLNKRKELKKTLGEMRKKSLREEAKLTSKLLQVRNEIAEDVQKANKKGDMGKCKLGMKNGTMRKAYCEVNFKDNYLNFMKCKDEDDFCQSCCDNEYGQMFVNLRKKCYKAICYMDDNKLSFK